MGAGPPGIKQAGPVSHLIHQTAVPQKEQIALKSVQLPLRINVVELWNHLGYVGIVLPEAVKKPLSSLPVYEKGKGENSILEGGQLLLKITFPDLKPAVALTTAWL